MTRAVLLCLLLLAFGTAAQENPGPRDDKSHLPTGVSLPAKRCSSNTAPPAMEPTAKAAAQLLPRSTRAWPTSPWVMALEMQDPRKRSRRCAISAPWPYNSP